MKEEPWFTFQSSNAVTITLIICLTLALGMCTFMKSREIRDYPHRACICVEARTE